MSSMDKECESGVFNYYCSEIDITTIINYLETYAMYKNYSLGNNVQVVVDKIIDSDSYISLKVNDRNKILNGSLDVISGYTGTCYKLLHDFIDYNEEDYKDKEQYLAFYEKFNINIYYDSTNYENYSSICVYFKNVDEKVSTFTIKNKEQNIHKFKETSEEQSIAIFADHDNNFLYHVSSNMTISIYNIIGFIRAYAANIKYELSDDVQVVITSLHHINNCVLINNEELEKAKIGNLFVHVEDTTFKICSDFIDYNDNYLSYEQYLSFYENFTISMTNGKNRRSTFSVYFKNISHVKKSNGYLNRIHMLRRENIDTFPKTLNSDYVISIIQEILKSNNNIVENGKNINIYMPYLSYNIKIDRSIRSIDEGVHYIIDGVTYIFHIDNDLPECFYYPDKKKSDSLRRDFNSVYIEIMRYNAIKDPILESEFEFYFN